VSEREQKEEPGASVRLQVVIPRVWVERLRELALERAVSMSDVVRIFLREALYGRRP
jgi:hypothetical protein